MSDKTAGIHKTSVDIADKDRINVDYDWELCTWARYFNTSERRVKEAVAAVGDSAVRVREHLHAGSGERPSAS